MSVTPQDEAAVLKKAEDLVGHLAAGGTLKSHVRLTDAEMEAMYAVAYNQFSARKYDEATRLFKFLCLYDHTQPRWFYGLGVVQQHARRYEDAVNAFAMATLLDVDDPRPQAQAGYCLLALERWPEAVSALEGAEMACGSDPAHARVRTQVEGLLLTARARRGGSAGV